MTPQKTIHSLVHPFLFQPASFPNVITYRKGRMKRSKYGTERQDKLAYQDMIKRYKINFNPLLLPKLALLGYHIRNDPSFQVFLAKLQLFDKSAIQRENLFVQHMKELMNELERQEEIMMMGMER